MICQLCISDLDILVSRNRGWERLTYESPGYFFEVGKFTVTLKEVVKPTDYDSYGYCPMGFSEECHVVVQVDDGSETIYLKKFGTLDSYGLYMNGICKRVEKKTKEVSAYE